MESLSVIIPAFNEEAAVGGVVRRIQSVLHGKYAYEILVVNDGSTDRTGEAAMVAGARVIANPVNMGYGFSLKRGFQEAGHECVVITDADGTYPAEKIPELVETFNRGFDMVVGRREGREYWSSVPKGIARWCFKWMSEYVVGKKIPDINSGFRVIRKSRILPVLPDLSNSFSFSTSSTLLFMLKHYFVAYVPVAYGKRTGKSKVRYFRDALIATQIMTEIIARYNPIKLFLFVAALPLLAATALLILAVVFVSGGFFLIGIVSLYFSLFLVALGFFASMFQRR